MKKLFPLLLISLSVLTSCGSNGVNPTESAAETVVAEPAAPEASGTNKTVVLITTDDMTPTVQRLIEEINGSEKFKDSNVEFRLNPFEDRTKFEEQLTVAFMGNNAYSLIGDVWESFSPNIRFLEQGYWADLNPFIKNYADFNNSTQFMQVFEAAEYKGKLFYLPNHYTSDYVLINKNLHTETINKFQTLDGISYLELFEFYNSVEDKQGLLFDEEFMPRKEIYWELVNFIDFDNKICNLNNPEVIDIMQRYKAIYDLDPTKNIAVSFLSLLWTYESDLAPSQQNMFRRVYGVVPQYVLPYNDNNFIQMIPITDKNGNLLLGRTGGGPAIYEGSKNKDLAWEFLKYYNAEYGIKSLSSGRFVNKAKSDFSLEKLLKYCITESPEHPLPGNEAEGIKLAIDIVNKIMERPVTSLVPNYFDVAQTVIEETFEMYLIGAITVEQAAASMQNKVSIYMTE